MAPLEQALRDPADPKRRAKYAAGGSVIALALIGLVVWGLTRPGSTAFYLTPAELHAMGPTEPIEDYRVNGKVVPGTVEREGLTTTFHITDGRADVEVTTDQPLPDAFYSDTDKIEVVAQGDYDGHRFVASQVFAKCPSKFKAKKA